MGSLVENAQKNLTGLVTNTTKAKTPSERQAAFLTGVMEAAQGAPPADAPVAPPPVAPDLADKLLRDAGAHSLLRSQAKQGRRSSFLTGAMGDAAEPLLTKKTTLGGL